MSRYAQFDISRLTVSPIASRKSKLTVNDILPVRNSPPGHVSPALFELSQAIRAARRASRPIIWFLGGHLIKRGLSKYIQMLLACNYITHLAGNGAVAIHDYELSTVGHTSESVPLYLEHGEFGHWTSMAGFNEEIVAAQEEGTGLGEQLAKGIRWYGGNAHCSVFCAADSVSVPATVHPLIGGDINHMSLRLRDAAALGIVAQRDFLIFAESVRVCQQLGGLFVCAGSAVHAPEVFLKALSMARNVLTNMKPITTAVLDVAPWPDEWDENDENPAYYARAFKTILNRAVAGPPQGRGIYVQGDHRDTIPALWQLLKFYDLDGGKDVECPAPQPAESAGNGDHACGGASSSPGGSA